MACTKEHVTAVASLHQDRIPTGFISHLGAFFLRVLYSGICIDKDSTIYVAFDEKAQKIVGFIACTKNTANLYRRIFFRRGLLFFLILLPHALRWTTLKRIFETLWYPIGHCSESLSHGADKSSMGDGSTRKRVNAELLAMATAKDYQSKGIGTRLVKEMERFYISSAIKRCKVVCFSQNQTTRRFYESCGYVLERTFRHHNNLMIEYIKEF